MPARLGSELWFPDPRSAHRGEPLDGLVAVGGDLSVERLLLAYQSGLFPWTSRPFTWWSPDPRAVFELGSLHIPRSLQRVLRQKRFEITINNAFREVIQSCAGEHRGGGTWITDDFISAYTALHKAGHAHSLECWQNDALVGGIYGVAIGGFFAGESMFHRVSNASKIALVHLHDRLRDRGFALFDIQMLTPVTRQLGARLISRNEYLARLQRALALPVSFE